MKLIRLLFIAVGKSVFKILNINDKTNTESRVSKNFIGFFKKTLFFLKKNKMFCEKTKVFFSKHFPLNCLADLMH